MEGGREGGRGAWLCPSVHHYNARLWNTNGEQVDFCALPGTFFLAQVVNIKHVFTHTKVLNPSHLYRTEIRRSLFCAMISPKIYVRQTQTRNCWKWNPCCSRSHACDTFPRPRLLSLMWVTGIYFLPLFLSGIFMACQGGARGPSSLPQPAPTPLSPSPPSLYPSLPLSASLLSFLLSFIIHHCLSLFHFIIFIILTVLFIIMFFPFYSFTFP